MIKSLILSWFIMVYFTTGIMVNMLQLCILPLFWIHRHTYQILTTKLAYCLFSVITFLAEWWGQTKLHMYGIDEDIRKISKEKSLTVINHYGDIDWLTCWVFAERLGFLGRTNAYIKDIIKYVPTMGWCWWFAGWGFLKRNWKNDQTQMQKHIDACKQNKTSYSITLFSEGTRRTEEKLKASQEFAIKNGKKPLKYHLYPRTKGFAVVVHNLRDQFEAIYDAEIAFPEPKKSTVAALFNKGVVEVHINLRRIPMSEVKCQTEEEAAEYCVQLYQQKDELMEYFEKNGKFPGERINLPRTPFHLYLFIFHNVWAGLLYASLIKYCVALYGSPVVLTFIGCIGLLTFVLTKVLLRFTETKKGSSFGLKKEKSSLSGQNNNDERAKID